MHRDASLAKAIDRYVDSKIVDALQETFHETALVVEFDKRGTRLVAFWDDFESRPQRLDDLFGWEPDYDGVENTLTFAAELERYAKYVRQTAEEWIRDHP